MSRFRPIFPLVGLFLIVIATGIALLLIARNLTFSHFQIDRVFYPVILLSSDTARSIIFFLVVPIVLVLLVARSWRRTFGIVPRAIIILLVAASWVAALFIVFLGIIAIYHHHQSLVVKDQMYHLMSQPMLQRRCDPYCYPPILVLFECDYLGVTCERVVLLGAEHYETVGEVNNAPYDFESVALSYREETQELEILLNGRSIYAYPLE